MAHLKCVVMVKAADKLSGPCNNNSNKKLVNDPDYKALRKSRKLRSVVRKLLDKTGIVVSGGGGIPELQKIPSTFSGVKITVY